MSRPRKRKIFTPPSSPARRPIKAPPDVYEERRGKHNNRSGQELTMYKVLWEAPEVIFGREGLQGILRSFIYETFDAAYTAIEVVQIEKVIKQLADRTITTGEDLVKEVGILTEGASKLVKENLMTLANTFKNLNSKLRF
jgi:hypothetical protein